MITVTKPYLPDRTTVDQYLDGIYKRNWLTNNGPLVNKYELELKKQLGLKHLLYVTNGTLALQLAYKALGLSGEVITTPFSYVATLTSLIWEGLTPVFVDIDEATLNIDPLKIESAITSKTTAIVATHCFGNPCDINAIQKIADKYKLRVIYDAAHAFGATYNGRSVFHYGDISTCSLHATKMIHSVEGGFVTTEDSEVLERITYLRNFGHSGTDEFNGIGINAKNSELHAAFGLAVLDDMKVILSKRRSQFETYNELLNTLRITNQSVLPDALINYSYYPIIFDSEKSCVKAKFALEKRGIMPRRYFYPSLNTLDYLSERFDTPVSESIASRIMCLPLFHELSIEEQDMIARILLRTQNYG
jgi:dTDP-4-amino-4,6-dideoxygalactose transaminase